MVSIMVRPGHRQVNETNLWETFVWERGSQDPNILRLWLWLLLCLDLACGKCAVGSCTVLHCTVLQCTAVHYIALQCTEPCCRALYFSPLSPWQWLCPVRMMILASFLSKCPAFWLPHPSLHLTLKMKCMIKHLLMDKITVQTPIVQIQTRDVHSIANLRIHVL